MANHRASWNYDFVAKIYDKLSSIYSLGMIRASKLSQIKEMNIGEKVLYIGAGTGEDALYAAKHGMNVTCIDISSKMVEMAKRRSETLSVDVEFICADINAYDKFGEFDVVVANFFLNMFEKQTMNSFLERITLFVKPGGRLMIADFKSPDDSGIASKIIQTVNFGIGDVFFWILRLAPLHKMYNYKGYILDAGLKLEKVKSFKLLKYGPVLYEAIVAKK